MRGRLFKRYNRCCAGEMFSSHALEQQRLHGDSWQTNRAHLVLLAVVLSNKPPAPCCKWIYSPKVLEQGQTMCFKIKRPQINGQCQFSLCKDDFMSRNRANIEL